MVSRHSSAPATEMLKPRASELEGRRQIVIKEVKPEVEGGRFPVKRIVGDRVSIEADIFADGTDVLECRLLHRTEGEKRWKESPMTALGNDRWRGEFVVERLGRHWYTLEAWVDRFETWRRDFQKRMEAGQDPSIALLTGAGILRGIAARASRTDGKRLLAWAEALEWQKDRGEAVRVAQDQDLARTVALYPDRSLATAYGRQLPIVVDREKARFSAWYEMFPRSCSSEAGRPGTFRDCEARLAYVAGMGFDVLYLPPIHPIGTGHRKGKDNAPRPEGKDPGSPWAIGSAEGGHKAVHPELGTLDDFRRFVAKARNHGLEVALDLAFQCSPDHPYVKEHPEWFRWRPDGTVQYAENPPKKYEDIYPFDFETDRWRELWEELKGVVLFWIDQGVRIFRVDNPHTKPFAFWEWLIGEVKTFHPDVIFLSEAFTRPKVMYHLAQLGFTQSYTYFAWRNTKWELTEYFTELAQSEVREFFRPNLWPNTPDILTEYLQHGGRPAFVARLVLAATLGANYGIYGPAFEMLEQRPREPGSEEYADSEKYELRRWEIERPDSLREIITKVNRARRDNPALQQDWSLRFHPVDNEGLLCYSKQSDGNIILSVVNLDPHHTRAGWVDLPLDSFGLDPHQPFQVHDLLTEARYIWHGPRNYVELNPHVAPAHLFRVRRRVRTEHDFLYFA